MSELSETRVVNCPYNLAQRYLAASVGPQATSGAASKLTLTAPVFGIDLAKDVVVTFGPGADPMHFDQPWHVHWTAQDAR
jgi:hypothetical protein